VVLATGARWRQLGVPGEQKYKTKGVTYCPHCDGPLFKGQDVAVVGGGNSGIEAAIDLAGVTGHVTVVEFMDSLKADAVLLDTLHSLPNVDVVTSAQSTQVVGDGSHVTGLEYRDRNTDELHTIPVRGIFVQIGLLPNTEWLEGAVNLTKRGEIIVNTRGATSVPGVFAAGDCTTQPYKQIIISMGSGATAALGAFDHIIRSANAAETLAKAS
jgi:alkyl hydroperoxide reductase subunit F